MRNKTPYLLCDADSDTVRLLTRAEAMRHITEAAGPGVAVIMDLSRCAIVFEREAGPKQEWSILDLRKVTAMTRRSIDHWVRAGVIPCSIRPGHGQGRDKERVFSRADAWLAAVAASLRRHGMPLPLLRRVTKLLAQTSRVEA